MGKKVKVPKSVKKRIDKQKHDEMLAYFIERAGNVTADQLAIKFGVKISIVNKWMKDEQWQEKYYEPVMLSTDTMDLISSAGDDFKLDEQEEVFCYHYLRTHNVHASALRAGYEPLTATKKGNSLLRKDYIKDFLKAIQSQMARESFLHGSQILDMYERIAFADINDYVQKGAWGWVPRKNFDGQVVTQMKETKDGTTVILGDRMKALEKLEEYVDLESSKRKAQQKDLELKEAKLNIERAKLGEDEREVLNDGFTEALKASVGTAWAEDEDEEED